MNFTYESNAPRVIFGAGKLVEISAEVALLNIRKPVIISTKGQHELALEVGELLGQSATIFAGAVMHVPTESIAAVLRHVDEYGSDGCVCIGGSSTIGLAKAVALDKGLPILAVPTTYAGSEMTPIWGITRDGVKVTGRDTRVQPKTVIYDPLLTLTLPASISAASGFNAMAHAIEALYAENKNPIISLLSETSIAALAASLPVLVKNTQDIEARTNALYGAWLAGTALGAVGMALHHKLCHVLGGSFSLPHAQVHSVMLPYSLAYNSQHIPEAMKAISRAMHTNIADVPGGLFDLVKKVEAPTALKDIGMKVEDIEKAAEIVMSRPYYNPRQISRSTILELLENAYQGIRP